MRVQKRHAMPACKISHSCAVPRCRPFRFEWRQIRERNINGQACFRDTPEDWILNNYNLTGIDIAPAIWRLPGTIGGRVRAELRIPAGRAGTRWYRRRFGRGRRRASRGAGSPAAHRKSCADRTASDTDADLKRLSAGRPERARGQGVAPSRPLAPAPSRARCPQDRAPPGQRGEGPAPGQASPNSRARRSSTAGQTSGLTRRGGVSPRSRPTICSAPQAATLRRASWVTPAVW